MKILLTGEPRSGKTTLLEDFILKIPNKQGFIARETRNNGEREGFESISSEGDVSALASIASDSVLKVGRYGVDLPAFDNFLVKLPPIHQGTVLYIDEIGKMQLLSDVFKKIAQQYLDAPNLFIGTIASIHSDSFISKVLGRPEVILLTVTPDNRARIKNILSGLASNVEQVQKLEEATQQKLIGLSQGYAKTSQWVQLGKLWKNAIQYVAKGQFTQISPTEIIVRGNTRDHKVVIKTDGMSCDCDLFTGTGVFQDMPGDCSHIQTAKLIAK